MTTGDFPSSVQNYPAPAVAGDFASSNPRASVLAGGGRLTSGAALYVGRFAWRDPYTGVANSNGTGAPAGFMGRNQQGLITTYLQSNTMQLVPGTQCWLYSAGDFWVENQGTLITQVGMKAYAKYTDGTIAFAASGSPPTGGSVTAAIAANATTSVTASILDDVMTVTAVGSGTLVAGATLSGTGVQSGTTIVKQLAGTAGGVGTYEITPSNQTVTSETITATYGVMTVSATGSGGLAVGDVLSGTNVGADTFITQIGTYNGSTGTVYVNNNTAVTSTTITAAAYYETKWYAMDDGRAVGELVRMSSWALG